MLSLHCKLLRHEKENPVFAVNFVRCTFLSSHNLIFHPPRLHCVSDILVDRLPSILAETLIWNNFACIPRIPSNFQLKFQVTIQLSPLLSNYVSFHWEDEFRNITLLHLLPTPETDMNVNPSLRHFKSREKFLKSDIDIWIGKINRNISGEIPINLCT